MSEPEKDKDLSAEEAKRRFEEIVRWLQDTYRNATPEEKERFKKLCANLYDGTTHQL